MKKLLEAVRVGVLAVLAVVVVIFLVVAAIIALPIDYIKYKTSLAYKKERRKYSLFATSSSNFKTYNMALKEHIPLEFVENPTYHSLANGWLVLGRTLVVSDVFDFEYDESAGHWVYKCENEHEELITETLDEYIKTSIDEANSGAGREICDSVAVLVDGTDEDYSGLGAEPSFIVYEGDIAEALHELYRRLQ